jgi:hypothetical protein
MKKMKKWMKFAAKNCHFCEIKRLKKNEKMDEICGEKLSFLRNKAFEKK